MCITYHVESDAQPITKRYAIVTESDACANHIVCAVIIRSDARAYHDVHTIRPAHSCFAHRHQNSGWMTWNHNSTTW